ncbi:MAG TPA: hypothetical protein VKT51_11425 [Candidatus Eremiobacteraceae bacterium]|nr:hypothetical protein [Candidatus Eremiobacteraceae bacterium]
MESQPCANPVGSAGTVGDGDGGGDVGGDSPGAGETSPGDAVGSADADGLSVAPVALADDAVGCADCCAVEDWREHAAVEATVRATTIRAIVQRVGIVEVLHR